MQEYYWDTFEKYCDSLTIKHQFEIVDKLRNAQKYINGLTDGWHEYLMSIKKVKKEFKSQLDKDDEKQLDYLIESIDKMLRDR